MTDCKWGSAAGYVKPELPVFHFAGYIKLELPVFHIGYFKNTVSILQCICKTCARVMVPDDERRPLLRRFRNPRTEARRLPPAPLYSAPTHAHGCAAASPRAAACAALGCAADARKEERQRSTSLL